VDVLGSLDSIKNLLDRSINTLGLIREQRAETGMDSDSLVAVVDVLIQRGAQLIGAARFADSGDGFEVDEA
jgi:hypothetical protein